MLKGNHRIVSVGDLKPCDEMQICAFLQGAVYVWCKHHPNEWFALRDLMGKGIKGDPSHDGNFFWNDTPLIALWEQQEKGYRLIEEPSDEKLALALKQAAANAGRLLKKVINDDKHHLFDTKVEDMTRKYMWSPESEDQEPKE